MNKLVLSLLLLLSVVGCGTSEPLVRTEVREVKVKAYVPLDEELTRPCLVPVFEDGHVITYGDAVTYSVDLLGTVERCNDQLAAIRKLQEASLETILQKDVK